MDKYFKQIHHDFVVPGWTRHTFRDLCIGEYPIPTDVINLIGSYCSDFLVNGTKFDWKIREPTYSSKSHWTCGSFDIGLPNKFFLELSRGYDTELGKSYFGVSLAAYPFPTPITSILFHCQLSLRCDHETDDEQQNKRLNPSQIKLFSKILQFSHASHPSNCIVSAGNRANDAYECMRYTWRVDDIRDTRIIESSENEEKEEKEDKEKGANTINVKKDITSFTIRCTIKKIRLYFFEDNGNTKEHSSNYQDYEIQDVIYNDLEYVQPLTHKFVDKEKFKCKWKLSKETSTGFGHSEVYYDMFQLQHEQNYNGKNEYGVMICGLPPKTHHIGVECHCTGKFEETEHDIYSAHIVLDYEKNYLNFDECTNNYD